MITSWNREGKYAAVNDELTSCLSSFREANNHFPMVVTYGNHDRNRDGNPHRGQSN